MQTPCMCVHLHRRLDQQRTGDSTADGICLLTSKTDVGVFCNSQKLKVACVCDSCYCMQTPWPSKSLPLWAKTELWA